MILVQIRDRAFLTANREVSPTINSRMFDYAGRTFEIDTDDLYIIPERTYPYMGYSWLGSWLIQLDKPNPLQSTPIDIPLEASVLSQLVPFMVKGLSDQVEHITFSTDKGSFKDITIQTDTIPVNFTFNPDATRLYVKFKGSAEYNISKYLRITYADIINTTPDIIAYTGGEGRNKELLAAETFIHLVKTIHGFVEGLPSIYMLKHKSGGVVAHYEGRDVTIVNTPALRHDVSDYFNPNNYRRFSTSATMLFEYADMMLVPLEPSDVELVIPQPFREDTDKQPKDYFVPDTVLLGSHTTYRGVSALRVSRAFYDTHFQVEPFTCAVSGIQFLSLVKAGYHAFTSITEIAPFTLSWFMPQDTYAHRDRVIAVPHGVELTYDFRALYEAYKPYIFPSIVLGVHTASDRYYTEAEYAEILQRERELEQSTGIRFEGERMYYRGKKYWLSDSDVIQDYDFEPDIRFHGDTNDLHLGVELEIDLGGEDHRNADIVSSIIGHEHNYVMHDGSLDSGFEIATMPMTLDYMHSIGDNFKDAFAIARNLGYKSHDTNSCGLHIHFDRSFFGRNRNTQNTKAAYLTLIMERNWEKFIKFSRRNYTRVEQWANKKDLVKDIYADDTEEDLADKFHDKYGNGDKYVALNTNHSNTYELRIFRGTLKYETFMATAQFVDNLVRVAKDCPNLAKAQQITFADIISYKSYPELDAYVNERGILTREYTEYRGE
jgi:hypothetical protein